MPRRFNYDELLKKILDSEKKRTWESLDQVDTAVFKVMPEDIAFDDLFNIDEIQMIQDQFSDATGVASIITYPDGTPITRPSNFCSLCNDIIRKTEKGKHNCYKSDSEIGRFSPDGPTIKPCMSGGLWDAGAAINVGGTHLANWLIGQVRDNTQKEEKIRKYAREIGADENEAARAFLEVPSMSRERFEKISKMLFTLANRISSSAYLNILLLNYIQEGKKTEAALKKNESFLNSIFENIPNMVFIKDAEDLRFVRFNRAGEKLLGYPREEMLGKNDFDFFQKEEAEFFASKDREVLRLKNLVDIPEETINTGNNVQRILHTKKIPIMDENGHPVYLLGISEDITERKKSEMELNQTRERLQSFMDSATDIMTLWDPDFRLIEMNNSAFLFFQGGITRDMMNEITIEDMDDYFHGVKLSVKFKEVRESGIPYTTEVMIKSDYDTPRWFNTRIFKVGEGIGTLSSDVTEVKRLEEQLRQSQKIESVGRLAGGVAHDFNNMLGIISGYADVLLNNMSRLDSETVVKYLNEIQKAADRSTNMTKQLLAFARKQTIEPKILDLNETVSGMLKMLGTLIGENINIAWHPGGGLWSIKMDPTQIDQVLANLCVNARDAIPDTGIIAIETRNVSVDETYCAGNPDCVPGDFVLLSVSDTGGGIDPDYIEKIFEPFFTTKGSEQGTGLGLSTVYGIVKQNNGFINVYSEPGKGSTFRVYFQRETDSTDKTDKTSDAEFSEAGDETILIVEDMPEILEMSGIMLEGYGYNVVALSEPEEAVKFIRENRDMIDLLITDVVMPGMNGRVLSEQIHAFNPRIKVLYMSGYPDDVIAHHGILEDGAFFIQKPFTTALLMAKVREVLDSD